MLGRPIGDEPLKKIPIRRPRKACTTCRGLKTRCLPDSEHSDPQARCSRCARLGLTCVYSRARRRPQSASPSSPKTAFRSHPTGHLNGGVHINNNSASMRWDMRNNAQAGPSSSIRLVQPMNGIINQWTAVQADSHHGTAFRSSPTGPYAPSTTGSLDTITSPTLNSNMMASSQPGKRAGGAVFTDFLEPHLDADVSRSPSPHLAPIRNSIYTDPVDSGQLSEPEARYLFDQFFMRVNASSGLFDTVYHTYDRVRTSPILFTAILAASSRFFRLDLVDSMHTLADTLIMGAVLAGEHDLQLAQAILVLVYWKRNPDDRTAYVKIGLACRILVQLRISLPTGHLQPAMSEEQERCQVDAERTMFNAFSMDMWYSLILQLPPNTSCSLPNMNAILAWADNHRHLDVPGDYFKAFVSGLWDIQKDVTDQPFVFDARINDFNSWPHEQQEKRLADHMNAWMNNPSLRGSFRHQAQLISQVVALKVRVTLVLQGADRTIPVSTLVSQAEDIGALITGLAAAGEFLYWYDLIYWMIPMPGIMLHKVRGHLSVEDHARVLAFCSDQRDNFERLGNAQPDTTFMYIGRFYGRLCKAFSRLQKGGDDPQVVAAINHLMNGVPHWSPLVNVMGDQGDPSNTEWAWLSMNHPQPNTWDQQ